MLPASSYDMPRALSSPGTRKLVVTHSFELYVVYSC